MRLLGLKHLFVEGGNLSAELAVEREKVEGGPWCHFKLAALASRRVTISSVGISAGG